MIDRGHVFQDGAKLRLDRRVDHAQGLRALSLWCRWILLADVKLTAEFCWHIFLAEDALAFTATHDADRRGGEWTGPLVFAKLGIQPYIAL